MKLYRNLFKAYKEFKLGNLKICLKLPHLRNYDINKIFKLFKVIQY